jgi:hypothetical protein
MTHVEERPDTMRVSDARPAEVDVAIVGSGFSGLGMAIRLKEEGIEDFVVLERAAEVGGTWHHNTYPGCGCDVPSHLYSFSFAPNPAWTRTYSRQPEIRAYLRDCTERYGLGPHVRLGHALIAAAWDEEAGRWQIETSCGPLSARVLVSGMGPLSEPSTPPLPGLEHFEGTVFHSARWNHDHSLEESGSRASGPAPRPSSSCPPSSRRLSASSSSSARRPGSCPTPTVRRPGSSAASTARCPFSNASFGAAYTSGARASCSGSSRTRDS